MAEQDHYLVVGGGGFLGKRIAELLLDLAPRPLVTILDLRRTFSDPRLTDFIEGDITDPVAVSSACKGKTVVIHTAAVIEGFPVPVYWKVNYEGTRNIINACREHSVRALVYTSSASVTYNGQDLRNGTEADPYCDVHMDTYNETKAAAEQLVLESNGVGGLATVSLRPAGIFGPGDNNASKGLYDAAKKGNWKFMIGDNSTLFDWTYVDNVAHAHLLAAQKLLSRSASPLQHAAKSETPAGQAFYITNDTPTFFWDVPKYLYNELGYRNTLRTRIPRGVGMILGAVVDALVAVVAPFKKLTPTFTRFRVKVITNNRYLDIAKAKTVLGYVPMVPLEEGLRRTALHWKAVDKASNAA
ncbi:3-beta hydroxysteroid dehydrogenase/isomerase family-domain-containing protein [Geranomyces variabilis]|nr:3-beta hydroxysteroid dehydrogenase/isomerase family-domain-containing protein [Geranomyces variabilis]KAJ3143311.1 erg26, C-3 sterol dehydrogenase [Geranomyces variabilis]